MKIFTKLFILLLFFTLLASCGKGPATKGEAVTITYYSRATAEQLVIWNKVIADFMKENPDINVRIENVVYNEYWSKLLTMSAGGVSPDVIFMESTRLPAFVEKDSLLSCEELIKKDSTINLNDFYPISLDISKYKGKIYGLPNDLAIITLYYNKDLFDQAGVAYPKAGWTWNDLITIGKQLTFDKNKDGSPDQYAITHYPWQIAVYQNNGDVVDNIFHPKKSTFSTPAVKEAITFCRDLAFKHKIAPPPVQQQYRSPFEMFTGGYVAMTIDGHWMVPYYRTIKSLKFDAVVLPKGKRQATMAYGSFFAIPKHSKHPEAAWKLIKYMAGKKGQEILVSDGFSVPALKAIANSKIFLSPPPDNQKAFLNMIAAGHLLPQSQYYMQLEDTWRNKLDLFWLNKTSVDKVTKEIDEDINKILGGK